MHTADVIVGVLLLCVGFAASAFRGVLTGRVNTGTRLSYRREPPQKPRWGVALFGVASGAAAGGAARIVGISYWVAVITVLVVMSGLAIPQIIHNRRETSASV